MVTVCVSYGYRVCMIWLPCVYHTVTVCASYGYRVCIIRLPCEYHIVSYGYRVCIIRLPCVHHTVTVCASCGYRVCIMWLPCVHHVVTVCASCGYRVCRDESLLTRLQPYTLALKSFGLSFIVGHLSFLSSQVLIKLSPHLSSRYTATVSSLECVTAPYPDAQEGNSSGPLQIQIISNGVHFVSYYHFRYDWNYTPQVSVRQTIRDQVFMVDSGCDYRDKEDGGGGGRRSEERKKGRGEVREGRRGGEE